MTKILEHISQHKYYPTPNNTNTERFLKLRLHRIRAAILNLFVAAYLWNIFFLLQTPKYSIYENVRDELYIFDLKAVWSHSSQRKTGITGHFIMEIVHRANLAQRPLDLTIALWRKTFIISLEPGKAWNYWIKRVMPPSNRFHYNI